MIKTDPEPENKIDQVKLFKLIFTANWEDPNSDYKALKIRPGDKMMTIISGGCNTLSFLAHDPGKIYAVDINPCQSWLIQLKIAAIREFSLDECLVFFGILPGNERLDQYGRIRDKLSPEARNYWDQQTRILSAGFLMNGRYEKFVKMVGVFIRSIQGGRRINGLFRTMGLEEQKEFYKRYWNTRRTRMIFNLFFNKKVLARRGLKADYFHFDDGSGSFAESFFKRFEKVLRDIPVQGNYFLHLYLKGKYRSGHEVPDYLTTTNYPLVKERLDRVEFISEDAKNWLKEMPPASIDCFSLSNICELMSEEDTRRTFGEVIRTARPGARVCFRNLMIPREVPEEFRNKIIKDEALSRELMETDRSFVYGKTAAYTIPVRQ